MEYKRVMYLYDSDMDVIRELLFKASTDEGEYVYVDVDYVNGYVYHFGNGHSNKYLTDTLGSAKKMRLDHLQSLISSLERKKIRDPRVQRFSEYYLRETGVLDYGESV